MEDNSQVQPADKGTQPTEPSADTITQQEHGPLQRLPWPAAAADASGATKATGETTPAHSHANLSEKEPNLAGEESTTASTEEKCIFLTEAPPTQENPSETRLSDSIAERGEVHVTGDDSSVQLQRSEKLLADEESYSACQLTSESGQPEPSALKNRTHIGSAESETDWRELPVTEGDHRKISDGTAEQSPTERLETFPNQTELTAEHADSENDSQHAESVFKTRETEEENITRQSKRGRTEQGERETKRGEQESEHSESDPRDSERFETGHDIAGHRIASYTGTERKAFVSFQLNEFQLHRTGSEEPETTQRKCPLDEDEHSADTRADLKQAVQDDTEKCTSYEETKGSVEDSNKVEECGITGVVGGDIWSYFKQITAEAETETDDLANGFHEHEESITIFNPEAFLQDDDAAAETADGLRKDRLPTQTLLTKTFAHSLASYPGSFVDVGSHANVTMNSLSPEVTIREWGTEAQSSPSPQQTTPVPGDVVAERTTSAAARESTSPPATTRAAESPSDQVRPRTRESQTSFNGVRPRTGESRKSVNGIQPTKGESENPTNRSGPQRAATESLGSDVRPGTAKSESLPAVGAKMPESESGLNGVSHSTSHDGQQQLSPAKDSEYGSPTRPKPPKVHFEKPSSFRMAQLDRHAMNTPRQLSGYPLSHLLHYLCTPAQTEVETAYILYRWVTCLNVKQGQITPRTQRAEEEEEEPAEAVLSTLATHVEQLRMGKIDHADIFSFLCKGANLETHKVEGRVRYYCPQPSLQLCRARPAAWSALLLPGGWGLVDCGMGARHWAAAVNHRNDIALGHRGVEQMENNSEASKVKGTSGSSEAVGAQSGAVRGQPGLRNGQLDAPPAEGCLDSASAREAQEYAPHNFYFLPPPKLLVTSHFPDNPCWQLLPHPLCETDFLTALLAKPHLHHLNLELLSPTSLRLLNIAEETDVVWRLKGEGLRRFAFRLFCLSNDGLSRKDLTRYGFLENQHAKGEATLRLIPPESGRYVCELYGTYLPSQGNEMTHVCSFDLDFVKTITTPLKFPYNERVEWGPGAECIALGLNPVTHWAGCVNVDKGETEVIFASSRPVLVTQKLLTVVDEGSGEEIPQSTLNFRDSKNNVRILLRIPEAGDFVLSIYAKEESSPGKCQLVCNYLVLCDSGTPEVVRPFPCMPYSKMGPTKAFTDFRMKLVCPKRSCIVVAPYSGKVTFVFSIPDTVELSSDLQHLGQEDGEGSDATDYVQHTVQSGESVFRVRLPLAGDYLFHLFGKPLDSEGHKFLLYTALIECAVPNKDCFPLSRIVPEWRSRVQILAPLRRCLVLGAVTHFAVRAHKVKGMAILGKSGTQTFINEDEEEEKNDDHRDNDGAKDNETEGKIATGIINHDTEETSSAQTDEKETMTDLAKTQKRRVTTDTSNENGNEGKDTTSLQQAQATGSGDILPDMASGEDSQSESVVDSNRKKMAMKHEEEEEEEEEGEDGWQVWRCSVKVNREDEGSGVKLCVQTSASRDSRMICVAEFEVITERTMAAKLEHQHAVWAEAEENFKVRPDSGHRSDLDDEERQSAYFLDDEVYLSNPLGDQNSDQSDDNDFSDEESEEDGDVSHDGDDERDSDSEFEDTTSSSLGHSLRGKANRAKVGFVEKDSKPSKLLSHRRQVSDNRGQQNKGVSPAKKCSGMTVKERARNERVEQMKRAFHPTLVYSAPQPGSCSTTTSRPNKQREESQREKARKDPSKDRRTERPRGRDQTDYRSTVAKREKALKTREELTSFSRKKGSRQSAGQEAETRQKTVRNVQKGEKHEQSRTEGSTNKSDEAAHQYAGTKERRLRRKMWSACQRRERDVIQKTVKRYNRGGYPPCPDLAEAERLLHLFELRDALAEALEAKDQTATREALSEVERNGYAGEMSVLCRKAHAMLSPHRLHNKLPVLVEADMRTLLEIRSYRCPPEVVHHVVIATLLLMGVHEGLTKRWTRCRRRLQVLGPQGIHHKMIKVKVETIHPEIAARARVLLDNHTLSEAHNAGPGVLAIYKWARGVSLRVENLAELDEAYDDLDENEPRQPASKRRQREIFKQQLTASNTIIASSTKRLTDTHNPDPVHRKVDDSPRRRRDDDKVSNNRSIHQTKAREDGEKDTRNHQKRIVGTLPGRSPRRNENVSKRDKIVPTDFKSTRQAALQGSSREPQEYTNRQVHEKAANDASSNFTSGQRPLKSKPAQDRELSKSKASPRAREGGYRTGTTVHPSRLKPSRPQGEQKGHPVQSSVAGTSAGERKTQTGHYSSQGARVAMGGRYSSQQQTHRPAALNGLIHKKPEKEEHGRTTQLPPVARAPATYRRYGEPLRSLSPHKSPLFKPVNKAVSKDSTKSRYSLSTSRPKTTPAAVHQSTFFFASLDKKDDSEEEENNNNVSKSFQNHSADSSRNRFTAGGSSNSAGSNGKTGNLPETKVENLTEASSLETGNGRRSISEMATPDI